ATYYDHDGGYGSCGWELQNSDFIVALGEAHYDDGSHCGDTVRVQYNGQTIFVPVADLCPGCQGDNGIDLSEGAMAALDENYVDDGVITVKWAFE
ncbi:RlpA-like double-psi beta-barrel-protein domain-containing protein-containing protein, partial [Mycena rosella]